MSKQGFIVFPRNFVDWQWYTDPIVCRVFEHLVFMCNHTDKEWRGILIKRGSLVTSYASLSTQTGLTVQEIRTALRKLQSTNDITKQSTNKNTLIIVTNYDLLQEYQQTINKQPTNNQQTSNKQLTTNNNDNNVNNENNDKNSSYTPHQKIIEMYNEICKKLPKVVKATEERKKYIGARYKEYKQELSFFEELFTKANNSSFLCGDNKNNWKANFDWLINQQNMAKVLEGRYDDRKQGYIEEETTW